MSKYLLIFLLFTSANAIAEVNKWVDSKGQVHFSDLPPPPDAQVSYPAKPKTPRPESYSGETVGKNDSIPASAPAAPKTIMERDADLKKARKEKQEAADKAALKEANAEIMKSNCAGAKQNLSALQSGVRIAGIDASGEQYFLDEGQLQQRIEKAQQAVSSYCK